MDKTTEEFEPLFDYSRVQPIDILSIDDDDCSDTEKALKLSPPKRRKLADDDDNNDDDSIGCLPGKSSEVVSVVDEKEEDWLLPPPVILKASRKPQQEDSTIKELRLKKQELASFALSAKDVVRAVEESAKRDLCSSVTPESEVDNFSKKKSEVDKPSKVQNDRPKIVISIQDKDGPKQFRVFTDEKFERIFKMYADKVKREIQNLVFCFDGDKISPTVTPATLGMEDDDIIEVHVKSA